jgi:hypothetical protein
MTEKIKHWTDDERAAGQKVAGAWKAFIQSERGELSLERAAVMMEMARITEVQDKCAAELLAMDNVVGVAAMPKVKGGKPTGTWTLTVLVEQKLPKSKVRKESLVPEMIDDVPTDVLEVGRIEALAFTARVQPALPGYSIGHYNITAGTFGCLVRDVRRCCCNFEKDCGCAPPRQECPGDILILSNNHVLANTNQGKPGDKILQPGPFDGGVFPSDAIATLDRFEEIVFGMGGYNLVDGAVGRPIAPRNVTAAIIGAAVPRGVNQVFPLDPVIKVGRTTQVTTGFVLATNAIVNVGFGPLVAQFRHQIITTAMAAGGDSGSLLMNFNLEGVGLLFAGSPVITIHNHLIDVQNVLGVELVTAS